MLPWLRFFGLFILIPAALLGLGSAVVAWDAGRWIDLWLLVSWGAFFLLRPGLAMGAVFVVVVLITF